MEDYRAYLLGSNGRVRAALDLRCESENEARERAQQLAQDCAVELWKGQIKIAEYPPPD